MPHHKGKPSGKYAESKTEPGRKGDYKRSRWPEDAATQAVSIEKRQQQGKPQKDYDNFEGVGRGRNRKAGSPI